MKQWLRKLTPELIISDRHGVQCRLADLQTEGHPPAFTVSHFVSALRKNNKLEIDYIGSEIVPCSIMLFPQTRLTPCWYLREHTNQVSRC